MVWPLPIKQSRSSAPAATEALGHIMQPTTFALQQNMHHSAMTVMLLVGRQVGCWHGYLSGARCRLATHPTDSQEAATALPS